MGQPPKAKPERKSQKGTDKKQSERFIKAARELGIEETSEFETLFKKVVPPKAPKPRR